MATDTGLQRTNNEDRVYMDAERGIFSWSTGWAVTRRG